MGEQRRSGFAKFANETKREEFVDIVLADDTALQSRAYISENQPTIVFENLTSDEFEKVRDGLRRRGSWVEDIQFESMQGPSDE